MAPQAPTAMGPPADGLRPAGRLSVGVRQRARTHGLLHIKQTHPLKRRVLKLELHHAVHATAIARIAARVGYDTAVADLVVKAIVHVSA